MKKNSHFKESLEMSSEKWLMIFAISEQLGVAFFSHEVNGDDSLCRHSEVISGLHWAVVVDGIKID